MPLLILYDLLKLKLPLIFEVQIKLSFLFNQIRFNIFMDIIFLRDLNRLKFDALHYSCLIYMMVSFSLSLTKDLLTS